MEISMKHSLEPWIPAAFCAFISSIPVVGSVIDGGGWWRPTFFAFLPMCFIFVGAAMLRMQREIRDLRMRLGEVTAIQVAAVTPIREKQ